VVLHCLEKLPSHRFQTAGELGAALRRVLEELGARRVHETILEALVDSGLMSGQETRVEEPPASLSPPRTRSLAAAVLGLAVAAALAVAGGAAIEYGAAGLTPAARPGRAARLELLPRERGYLRVLADPWERVGRWPTGRDDPFAQPIPLAVGTHHVRSSTPARAAGAAHDPGRPRGDGDARRDDGDPGLGLRLDRAPAPRLPRAPGRLRHSGGKRRGSRAATPEA
jgi:hypothetical protein